MNYFNPKNRHWLLFLFAGALFVSCHDEQEYTPTSLISKVETDYHEGVAKFEGFTNEMKVESSLPDDQKFNFFSEVSKVSESYVKNKRSYNPTARTDFGGYDVGVFPLSGQCPVEYEQVEIFMDCEDSNPATKVTKNFEVTEDQYAIRVDGNKNIRLIFCRVDGRLFKAFKQESGATLAYGVLQLGNLSISTYPYYHLIKRNFDNEDSSNKNSYVGDIAPNVVNSNTTLRISVVASTPDVVNSGGYMDQGIPVNALGGQRYGIFSDSYISPSGLRTNRGYKVSIDDEDSSNANWCTYDGYAYQNYSSTNSVSWLVANSNTYFNVVFPYF